MRSYKMLFFLLFIVSVTSASAQNADKNKLDSFAAKFISAIRADEKERAWVVTDKSVFRAGEYIWFRAFLLNNTSQKLSSKSRLLFVDVVNDKDDIIKRIILDAASGQLNSRIQLPDSLEAGYYWLRAYTKQMAEHDTNSICIKPLYISPKEDIGHLVKPKNLPVSQDGQPIINFYPEGDNIITGINSTVALQATLKNGEPLGIEGFVKNNADEIVTKFVTNSTGFAKFDFEPSGYKKYKAVINWQGKEISYPLPSYNFYGGQVGVSKQYNNYKLRILLGDSIYSKTTLTYIIGISGDSLIFAAIGKGQYEINVDAGRLPQGIATFYLFDKNFKPLSERSIYASASKLKVNIATDKSIYPKRAKVTLDLSITDAEQHAVPALIAVSVSDSVLYSQDQCYSADSPFNLQHIDNLSLSNNNCFSDDDIDLMMLARKNTYQTLNATSKQPATAADDSSLFISGRLVNEKKEAQINKAVTLFSGSGSAGLFAADTTDNTGRFSFPLDVYPDSTQFAVEVKDLNNHPLYNTELQLDTLVYPKLNTPVTLKKYLTGTSATTLKRLSAYNEIQWSAGGGHHLPPVTVKDNIKAADYDVSKRVSSYSPIISGKDLDGRTSVDNLILRVSGLQLLNGYLVIHGLNAMKSPGASDEPMLLVEGSQVVATPDNATGTVSPVMSYLHNLNPKDIDFIEVLKDGNAANYGVRGGNGVILINLSNKGHNLPGATDNIKIFYARGVSKPSLFPILNYDVKDKKAEFPPDDRSTIFWNGNFLTGDKGNSTFTFYTSDVPSTYNITVTGITAQGGIISKTITVKSK